MSREERGRYDKPKKKRLSPDDMLYVGLWLDLSPYRGDSRLTPPDKLEWWLEKLGLYSSSLFFAAGGAIRHLDAGAIAGHNLFYSQQRRISEKSARQGQSGARAVSRDMRTIERETIAAFEKGRPYVGPDVIGRPYIPRARRRR